MPNDVLLQLKDIDGDAIIAKHDKWIAVENCSLGLSAPMSAAAVGQNSKRETANFQDFQFSKPLDSSSVLILQRACDGAQIKDGKVHFMTATKGDEVEWYYELEMKKIYVTSYSVSGQGTNAYENFTLRPDFFIWRYKPKKDDGTLDAAKPGQWNIQKQQKAE